MGSQSEGATAGTNRPRASQTTQSGSLQRCRPMARSEKNATVPPNLWAISNGGGKGGRTLLSVVREAEGCSPTPGGAPFGQTHEPRQLSILLRSSPAQRELPSPAAWRWHESPGILQLPPEFLLSRQRLDRGGFVRGPTRLAFVASLKNGKPPRLDPGMEPQQLLGRMLIRRAFLRLKQCNR